MGIFDFFRAKKPVQEIRKIEFARIDDFLEKEKQKIAESETASITLIKDDINGLKTDFEEEISALNKIDLKERKEDPKMKLIVLENAKTFGNYLEKLKLKMENLNSTRLPLLISEIDLHFQEFKKKAHMSREKASILIGKEISDVRATIDSFYENMNEILESNKKLIENSTIIEKSESLCKEIEEIKEIEAKMQADTENAAKISCGLEEQKEDLEKKLIEIKESKEYSQKLKRKNEFENEKDDLKKQIAGLKSTIDFKELTRIHHAIPSNMKIIKEYSENIHDALEKDKGRSILELLKDKEKISKEIDKILEKEKHILEFVHEKDDILETQEKIKDLNNKIREAEEDKARLKKKISGLEDKISDVKERLAKELNKIGIKLEY